MCCSAVYLFIWQNAWNTHLWCFVQSLSEPSPPLNTATSDSAILDISALHAPKSPYLHRCKPFSQSRVHQQIASFFSVLQQVGVSIYPTLNCFASKGSSFSCMLFYVSQPNSQLRKIFNYLTVKHQPLFFDILNKHFLQQSNLRAL